MRNDTEYGEITISLGLEETSQRAKDVSASRN